MIPKASGLMNLFWWLVLATISSNPKFGEIAQPNCLRFFRNLQPIHHLTQIRRAKRNLHIAVDR